MNSLRGLPMVFVCAAAGCLLATGISVRPAEVEGDRAARIREAGCDTRRQELSFEVLPLESAADPATPAIAPRRVPVCLAVYRPVDGEERALQR
jgi:hypothetical protein